MTCFRRDIQYYRLTILLASLSGCTVPYKPPENAPLTKVRFITADGGLKCIFVFANENCERGEFGGQLAVIGGWGSSGETNRLNMYGAREQNIRIAEREVQAGQRFYFAFHESFTIPQASTPNMYYTNTYSCNVTLSFIPKQDHQYEVLQTMSGFMNCDASVAELVKMPDGRYKWKRMQLQLLIEKELIILIKPLVDVYTMLIWWY